MAPILWMGLPVLFVVQGGYIGIITAVVQKEEYGCVLFVTAALNTSGPQGAFWCSGSYL